VAVVSMACGRCGCEAASENVDGTFFDGEDHCQWCVWPGTVHVTDGAARWSTDDDRELPDVCHDCALGHLDDALDRSRAAEATAVGLAAQVVELRRMLAEARACGRPTATPR
jgi:Zn-finger protein